MEQKIQDNRWSWSYKFNICQQSMNVEQMKLTQNPTKLMSALGCQKWSRFTRYNSKVVQMFLPFSAAVSLFIIASVVYKYDEKQTNDSHKFNVHREFHTVQWKLNVIQKSNSRTIREG